MANKHEPTMAWHPETGESKIFNHPSEVPAEWLDTHPKNVAAKPKEDPKPVTVPFKDEPMSKDEITAALTAGGIQFDANAKAKVLQAVLRDAVVKALTDSEVKFEPDTSTKALLALLPDPE